MVFALLLTSPSVAFAWLSYSGPSEAMQIQRFLINMLAGLPSWMDHADWLLYPDRVRYLTGSGFQNPMVVLCIDRHPLLVACTQADDLEPSSEISLDDLVQGKRKFQTEGKRVSKCEGDNGVEEWESGRLSRIGLETCRAGKTIYCVRAITLTAQLLDSLLVPIPTVGTTESLNGARVGFHRLYLWRPRLFEDDDAVKMTQELFLAATVEDGRYAMLAVMGYDNANALPYPGTEHEIAMNFYCADIAETLRARVSGKESVAAPSSKKLGGFSLAEIFKLQNEHTQRPTLFIAGMVQVPSAHLAVLIDRYCYDLHSTISFTRALPTTMV